MPLGIAPSRTTGEIGAMPSGIAPLYVLCVRCDKAFCRIAREAVSQFAPSRLGACAVDLAPLPSLRHSDCTVSWDAPRR